MPVFSRNPPSASISRLGASSPGEVRGGGGGVFNGEALRGKVVEPWIITGRWDEATGRWDEVIGRWDEVIGRADEVIKVAGKESGRDSECSR
eukprot:scaffold47_cov112-Isochrysis_galbana.AAC.4